MGDVQARRAGGVELMDERVRVAVNDAQLHKRLAGKPSLDEVLGRIERRRGGRVGLRQAAEDLAEEQARR